MSDPIIITWKKRQFVVEVTEYLDNQGTCIVLLDPDSGQLELKVTINMHKLSPHMVFVKNYSENKGIAEVMIGSQLLTPTGHTVQAGHVDVAQYVLLPRLAKPFNIELPEVKTPLDSRDLKADQAIARDTPQAGPQAPSDEDVGEAPANMSEFERQQIANRLTAERVADAEEDDAPDPKLD